MCCPTARPPPWPRGCGSIRAPRSSAATARPATPKPSARAPPKRRRPATAGTCGTGWAVRCGGEDRHRPQHKLARRTVVAAARTAAPDRRADPDPARRRAHPARSGCGPAASNTVKHHARAATAKQLARQPRYGRTLVDPYREHLRQRLAAEPDVRVTRLLEEIRELGYTGSANLLVRYLNQGRAQARARIPAAAAPRSVDHEQARRAARTRPQPPRRAAGRMPAPHGPRRARPHLRRPSRRSRAPRARLAAGVRPSRTSSVTSPVAPLTMPGHPTDSRKPKKVVFHRSAPSNIGP
jgi:hypothetical protein